MQVFRLCFSAFASPSHKKNRTFLPAMAFRDDAPNYGSRLLSGIHTPFHNIYAIHVIYYYSIDPPPLLTSSHFCETALILPYISDSSKSSAKCDSNRKKQPQYCDCLKHILLYQEGEEISFFSFFSFSTSFANFDGVRISWVTNLLS